MANNFNQVVKDVSDASSVLNQSVGNVAVVAEQTNQNVKAQRVETEQVAAAITEMNASAQEIANNTAMAASAADDALRQTGSSSDLVHQTQDLIDHLSREIQGAVEVMKQMAQESKNIGGVLDVIKSVAEQTNLLALNAAIEAARAGEQGRGFAVVADEVRTLAQKTHSSTEEIQQMIERLQSRSRDAVAVIEKGQQCARETDAQSQLTVTSLGSVTAAIEQLHGMITGIASAAEEQTAVCEEINRNICNIEDSTRDTSVGAEQTAMAGCEMASQAERLKTMVGQFQTA